jgi:hypothetical protein
MIGNKEHKASLSAGATPGLNNCCVLAVTPATEEFFHISPALITSSANKRGGVRKSVITNNSAGNFNSRPVTSRPEGGVTHDAKSVNADNRYLLNNKSGAK